MTNYTDPSEEKHSSFAEKIGKTEAFIEQNKKILLIIGAVILGIVAIYFGYQKLYLGPKEKEAQSQMFMAEKYYGKDSLKLALKGDGNNPGFIDIIEDYGITQSGNLACYYAGMCYLKLGDFNNAIEYLKKFDSEDQIISPMAIGAIGDANIELGNTEEGIKNYLKASEENLNTFTTPIFLMKAALAYEDLNNLDEAIKLYEKIKREYPRSYEGREAEKFLARAKTLQNK